MRLNTGAAGQGMDISRQAGNKGKDGAWWRLGSVALGLLAASTSAAAFWDDKVELYVSETLTYDNNLYRLSKDQDAEAILGTSKKSDFYTTTAFGVNFDVPISRQRIKAGLSMNKVHYDRFSNLDYDGRDSFITWLWQVGNDLNGELGYTDTKSLGSFADFEGTDPNLLTNRRLFGTASFLLTPSWEIQGGFANRYLRNDNVEFQDNDVDIISVNAGVNYVSPAKNKIGIDLRQEDGRYKHPEDVAGTLVDNDYRQQSIGIVTDWTISGKSHLNFRVDRVNRDYDELSDRNYSGTTFLATYDWKPTGKLTISTIARRDISLTEDTTTDLVLVKGVSVIPNWRVTEKTTVTGLFDYSVRDYLGSAAEALDVDPSRTDHLWRYGAAVSYRAMRSLTFYLQGRYERRTSNVPLNDYTDGLISLNARFAF